MREPAPRSVRLLAALVLLAALLALPQGARAQGMTPGSPTEQTSEAELALNRRARALTDQMMSPWCKGVTVTQCSSGVAANYRSQVRAWLEAGVSEADIKRGFAQQFGEDQLGMPRGPMSWTVPLVILAFGAVVLVILVRRLTLTPAAQPAAPDLNADQYRKLEAELDSKLSRRKLD